MKEDFIFTSISDTPCNCNILPKGKLALNSSLSLKFIVLRRKSRLKVNEETPVESCVTCQTLFLKFRLSLKQISFMEPRFYVYTKIFSACKRFVKSA